MTTLRFGRHAVGIGLAAAMLAGCGGSQPPMPAPGTVPQSAATAQVEQSELGLPEASVPAVLNIAGVYYGTGRDSVLGKADYTISFTQSGSSLKSTLAVVNQKKQYLETKLKGSVTKDGYIIKAFGKCTGRVRGLVSGSMLSGLYKALTCGGVAHTGSFGAMYCKDCKAQHHDLRRH
jgi:hypothetical protein